MIAFCVDVAFDFHLVAMRGGIQKGGLINVENGDNDDNPNKHNHNHGDNHNHRRATATTTTTTNDNNNNNNNSGQASSRLMEGNMLEQFDSGRRHGGN